MKNLVFLSLLFISAKTCTIERTGQMVFVTNNTDSVLYFPYSYKDSLSLLPYRYYMDTIKLDNKLRVVPPMERVEPHSTSIVTGKYPIRNSLRDSGASSLKLFVIKESNMKKYKWEDICKCGLYEGKIVIPIEKFSQGDSVKVQYPECEK